MLQDVFLVERVDACGRGRAGCGLPGKGPAQIDFIGGSHGFVGTQHRGNGQCTACDGFSQGHEVHLLRHLGPPFNSEHLARAAESGLHLIIDHHPTILLAHGVQPLHPAIGGDEDAVFALNGLVEHARDGFGRGFVAQYHILNPVHARQIALRIGLLQGTTIASGVRDMDEAMNVFFDAPSDVGRRRPCSCRAIVAAVEGTVESDDKVAPGGLPGQAQRSFHRLGAGGVGRDPGELRGRDLH